MKDYPSLTPSGVPDILELLRYITKERPNDIREFENLKNVFMSGRKVGKIPTGATDTTVYDRVGDFNFDNSYLYLVIDDSGTAKWARVALNIAW